MASMKLPRKLGRRLWLAHLGFQEHEGALSAAGIAYYVALSFFPLLLVLVAGLAAVLAVDAGRAGSAAGVAGCDRATGVARPGAASRADRSMRCSERAPASGPIGFVVLVVSAIAIFAQLDAAFDRIWRLPRDPHATWRTWVERLVFQRLKALGMLVGVGGFIVLVMITSMVWAGIEQRVGAAVRDWAVVRVGVEFVDQFAAQFDRIHDDLPRGAEAHRFAGGTRFGAVVWRPCLWEAGRQALRRICCT